MNLELTAMRWLWIEKNCHIVLEQRSPKFMNGLPDVIGVTASRYLTEIEIKRSETDFTADFKKPHRANRNLYLKHAPRHFYYLMPKPLADKLQFKIPEWAGLMYSEYDNKIVVLKVSPINKLSEKLTSKECVRLGRQMTNHVMGYALKVAALERNRILYFDPCSWVSSENGTYQI